VSNERQNLFPHDTGHEFKTFRETINIDLPTFHFSGSSGVSYVGPLIPQLGLAYMQKPVANRYQFDPPNLAIGTEFLAKLRPTNAAANVAQAIIETIRDVPKIPFNQIDQARRATQLLRTGSDEYLNIVFGWSPLVSDVLKTCRAIVYSDAILQQYRRDSGRQVRRRAANPVRQTSTYVDPDGGVLDSLSPGVTGFFGTHFWASSNPLGYGMGRTHTTITATEKYWFSGAFSYLLTGDESVYDKSQRFAQLANKLLGIRMDATVLWELAPWSWLSDWFTSIGSVIRLNNDMNQDNLVVRYGYLMRSSVVTIQHQHDGLTTASGSKTPHCSSFYKKEQKERVRATPYGFGFDLNLLSPTQIAVLGSLGLTKSPGKFWWG